jgi:hypothetical protein
VKLLLVHQHQGVLLLLVHQGVQLLLGFSLGVVLVLVLEGMKVEA